MRKLVLGIATTATLFAVTGAAATTLSVGASHDAQAGLSGFVSCNVGTVTVDPVTDGTDVTGIEMTSTGGTGENCSSADNVFAFTTIAGVDQRMYVATTASALLGSAGSTTTTPHSVVVPFDTGNTNVAKDAGVSVVFNNGACQGRTAHCEYDLAPNDVYLFTDPTVNSAGWPLTVRTFDGDQSGVLVTRQPQSDITNFGHITP